MGKNTVLQANIVDIEKRRLPSKHYVYVIQVTWSNRNQPVLIYRRYSKFFDFQCTLLERFPDEGGCKDPRDRMIPFLPGKILFGRSCVRTVAMKRKELINEYLQKLIKLPVHISECDEVLRFFDLHHSDISKSDSSKSFIKKIGEEISAPLVLEQYTVIADYVKEQKNEVTIKAGMVVEVIDKNLSGWWLVSVDDCQGWVPASYLDPIYGDAEDVELTPDKGEQFICRQSYVAAEADEVCLERGQFITVLGKKMDGWWRVKAGENEGLAPAAFLEKVDQDKVKLQLLPNKRRFPVSIIDNVMDISNLKETSVLNNSHDYTKVDESNIAPRVYQEAVFPADTDVTKTNNRKNKKKQPPKRGSIKRTVQKPNIPPTLPDPPKPKTEYVTIGDFETNKSTDDGAISIYAGVAVEVLERASTGWWYICFKDKYGWAPSSYIQEKKIKPERPPLPIKLVDKGNLNNGSHQVKPNMEVQTSLYLHEPNNHNLVNLPNSHLKPTDEILGHGTFHGNSRSSPSSREPSHVHLKRGIVTEAKRDLQTEDETTLKVQSFQTKSHIINKDNNEVANELNQMLAKQRIKLDNGTVNKNCVAQPDTNDVSVRKVKDLQRLFDK